MFYSALLNCLFEQHDDGSNVSQQLMYTTVDILSSIELFIQAAYDVGRYS